MQLHRLQSGDAGVASASQSRTGLFHGGNHKSSFLTCSNAADSVKASKWKRSVLAHREKVKSKKKNLAHRVSHVSCTQVSRNIVMEAHLIRTTHFTGITCTAYQRRDIPTAGQGTEIPESVYEQRLRFRCSTGSHNTSLNDFPLKVRRRHRLVFFGSFANAYFTL